ncbi:MAG: peptidoglycan DD-metalloendopeptidase family protein [Bradymonadia bacterium]
MAQDSDTGRHPTARTRTFYLAYAAIVLGGLVLLGALLVDDKETATEQLEASSARSVENPKGGHSAEATKKGDEFKAKRPSPAEVSTREPLPSQPPQDTVVAPPPPTETGAQTSLIKPAIARKNPDLMPKGNPSPLIKSGELGRGQTVGGALQNFGVGHQTVTGIIAALDGLYDFRIAQPGARFEVQLTPEGQLKRFQFEHDLMEVYVVERDAQGKYRGRQALVPVTTTVEAIGGRVKGSLYATIKALGESSSLASKLVSVFAWDLDFYKDSREGDRFKLVVEKHYKDGDFVQYGRVLAAEYVGKKGIFQSFWFKPSDQNDGGYFLKTGESAEKVFLATPLKFARVSSGFNRKRKHPILGYTKAHLGVDYAAPRGTPVWAMARGKVLFSGRKGPSGNLVRIDHGNGLVSAYAHLHRIRKEVRKGVSVKQKQVIGYVGSTGRSTGPHLHFAIRKKGRYVNPRDVKVGRLKSVPKRHNRKFRKVVKERMKQLEKLDVSQPTGAQ